MRNTTLCSLLLVLLACSCVKRQTSESAEGDASAQPSVEAVESNDSNETAGDSIANNNWSDVAMPEGILQTLPKTAILCDIKGSFELYKNLDIECCDEHPNQWSLWLRDKETGKVIFLIQTNNDAEPRWEEMTDVNALEVPLEQIAAGDCDQAFLIPNAPGKVFVEGCPDGRNIWSYIYNFNMQRIIQLPTNEGFVDFDIQNNYIRLSHYRYYPEGGRYSVIKTFTYSGRFIGEEKQDPEENNL